MSLEKLLILCYYNHKLKTAANLVGKEVRKLNLERVQENFAERLRELVIEERLWIGREQDARFFRKVTMLFIDPHFSFIGQQERERIFSRVFQTEKLRLSGQTQNGKAKVVAGR